MDEYIEREAAIRVVNGQSSLTMTRSSLIDSIRKLPTADVAPVVHGRWVLGTVEPGYLTPGGNRPWICSECKQVISWSLGRPYKNYCPHCGAKMDGGDE